MAGVAARRARHDRQRHQPDRADRPGMEPGHLQAEIRREHTGAGEEEAQRHKAIGEVQHPDQRFRAGPPRQPARLPRQVQRASCDQEETRCPRRTRCHRQERPEQEAQRAARDHECIEPVERHRQLARFPALEPVGGEARDDPPADQGDEKDRDRDAEPVAADRGTALQQFGVKERLRNPDQDHRAEHRQVAPVAPGEDLAAEKDRERHRECGGERRHEGAGQQAGRGDGEASRQPDRDEPEERPADDRKPPRPVGHRREEEARDHRRDEAEDQFMRVPGQRPPVPRRGHGAGQHQQPDEDHRRGIGAADQEEGAEAEAEQCRAAPGPHALHGCRNPVPGRGGLAPRAVGRRHRRGSVRVAGTAGDRRAPPAFRRCPQPLARSPDARQAGRLRAPGGAARVSGTRPNPTGRAPAARRLPSARNGRARPGPRR